MSTSDEHLTLRRKRRVAAAAFIALLALAIFWPAPVLTINDVCCDARLTIDDLSFLGREAPSWDVAFWCIAGLLFIAIVQSAESRDFGELWRIARASRLHVPRRTLPFIAVSALLVVAAWHFADRPFTAFAERVESDQLENIIRIFNRLGGGMNPGLIAIFFAVAGVAYRHRRWAEYAVAMAFAGAAAGIGAQLVKQLAARGRPELWLGPSIRTHVATSFPSGHTIGAFALAGILLFASRNLPLRIVSIALACAVGAARILAFRHWTSDVVASALLGLLSAYVASMSVHGAEEKSGDGARR